MPRSAKTLSSSNKKKKKKNDEKGCLARVQKVTGDLSEERVNILLFGYPDGQVAPEIDDEERSDHILLRKRPLAPQTKHFSQLINERASSPVVSPRYGLSGDDETAWQPYFGKKKSFKNVTNDVKQWSKRIRETIDVLMVKYGEERTKHHARAKSNSQTKEDLVKRIKSQMPGAEDSSTDVVLDLIELSDEMADLRHMLSMETEALKDLSADTIEQILFESTQLGHSADQVNLLDVHHTAIGFAKNLRGIWELLYLRATGEYLPTTEKEISEVEELQLRTVDADFAKPLAEEEDVRNAPVVEEEDDIVQFHDISTSTVTKETTKDSQQNVNLNASFCDSIDDEDEEQEGEGEDESDPSLVLQNLIDETSKKIEPATVPVKSFEFSLKNSASLKQSIIGFEDDKDKEALSLHSDSGREFDSYNDILERRTTVYDGKLPQDEPLDEKENVELNRLRLRGSFQVNAINDEIDKYMQSELTKSSISEIDMRYTSSSSAADSSVWSEKQRANKLELIARIKSGNFFPLNKFRKALTPEPQRTPVTPRTPVPREVRKRQHGAAKVVDKRPLFDQLKKVSVDFGFAPNPGVEEPAHIVSEKPQADELPRQETLPTSATSARDMNTTRPSTVSTPHYLSSPQALEIGVDHLLCVAPSQEGSSYSSALRSADKESYVSSLSCVSSPSHHAKREGINQATMNSSQENELESLTQPKVIRVKVTEVGSGLSPLEESAQSSPWKKQETASFTSINQQPFRTGRSTSPTRYNKAYQDKSPKSHRGHSSSPSRSTAVSRSPVTVLPSEVQESTVSYHKISDGGNDSKRVHTISQNSVQLTNELQVNQSSTDKTNDADEKSVSTMFSITVSVPSADRPPPNACHRDPDTSRHSGDPNRQVAVLQLSRSFVEENHARALRMLTHRPVKRVNSKYSESQSKPLDQREKAKELLFSREKKQEQEEDSLNIVGNVSPRIELPEEHQQHRPATTPVQKRQQQQVVNKHILKLSLPTAPGSTRDSFASIPTPSSGAAMRRNYSADSLDDSYFNLSAASNFPRRRQKEVSVETQLGEMSELTPIPTVRKNANCEKTSIVSYSRTKTSLSGRFTSRYPLRVKGINCEEIFFDSVTGNIIICSVAGNGEASFSRSIPIKDIMVTYGNYDGVFTLRCKSNEATEDYVASIKCGDWKRIVAQVENGLKRSFALRKKVGNFLFHSNTPRPDTSSRLVDILQDEFSKSQLECPVPPHNSEITKSKMGMDDSPSISALQSLMDDMVSYPVAANGGNKEDSGGEVIEVERSVLDSYGPVPSSICSNDDELSQHSDEINRSTVAKRNQKGAVPLPVIDDNVDDENVFLTGFNLKQDFSRDVGSPRPLNEATHDELKEYHQYDEAPIAKEIKKFSRRFVPSTASRVVTGDRDVNVDYVISKYDDSEPLPQTEHPEVRASTAKTNAVFQDQLPRTVSFQGDDSKWPKHTQHQTLRSTAMSLKENIKDYRQRTALNKRRPLSRLGMEQELASQLVPNPPEVSGNDEVDGSSQNFTNKRIIKRPDSKISQSFKSPRAGKGIKPTSHANVFISNEVDTQSSLSQMIEVGRHLKRSREKMRESFKRHQNGDSASGEYAATTTIDLKLNI